MKRLGSLTAVLATMMAVGAYPVGPAQSVPVPHAPHRVVVIIFENKPYTHVVGSSAAPYFNALMHTGTLFTNYSAIRNGSTRNYRAISSGLTEGQSTGNIFRAIDDSHGRVRWVELNESMRNNCGDGSTGMVPGTREPLYYKGHDYALLNKGNESCAQHDVPMTNATFDPDTLPDLTFIVPNMCTDMHTTPKGGSCPAFFGDVKGNGSLQLGDAWLKKVVTQLLAQPDITVIVTFDEGANSSHQHIVTLEAGAGVAAGGRDSHAYNHYGLLAGLYKTFALGTPPNNAAHATPLPIG
jgi:hypothetical protein